MVVNRISIISEEKGSKDMPNLLNLVNKLNSVEFKKNQPKNLITGIQEEALPSEDDLAPYEHLFIEHQIVEEDEQEDLEMSIEAHEVMIDKIMRNERVDRGNTEITVKAFHNQPIRDRPQLVSHNVSFLIPSTGNQSIAFAIPEDNHELEEDAPQSENRAEIRQQGSGNRVK